MKILNRSVFLFSFFQDVNINFKILNTLKYQTELKIVNFCFKPHDKV